MPKYQIIYKATAKKPYHFGEINRKSTETRVYATLKDKKKAEQLLKLNRELNLNIEKQNPNKKMKTSFYIRKVK